MSEAEARARWIAPHRDPRTIDQFAWPALSSEAGVNRTWCSPGHHGRSAKELIGKTAQLEFKLDRREGQQLFERLDNALALRVKTGQVKVDTSMAAKPLTSHFLDLAGAAGFVLSPDVPTVKEMLAQVDTTIGTDVQLAWAPETEGTGGRRGQWLYALRKEAALGGERRPALRPDQPAEPGGRGRSPRRAPRAAHAGDRRQRRAPAAIASTGGHLRLRPERSGAAPLHLRRSRGSGQQHLVLRRRPAGAACGVERAAVSAGCDSIKVA